MACAGIILGDAYAEYEVVLKSVDAGSASALEAFRRMTSGHPYKETSCKPDVFAGVMSEVVQPLDDEKASLYIEKAAVMDKDFFDAIKLELQRIRRYALLEKLYETRARKKALQKGQDMFFAGVYAMMQNEFERAGEHFTAAMHSGYYSDEMKEYVRISKGETVLKE
jgi:hypothetical protein